MAASARKTTTTRFFLLEGEQQDDGWLQPIRDLRHVRFGEVLEMVVFRGLLDRACPHYSSNCERVFHDSCLIAKKEPTKNTK